MVFHSDVMFLYVCSYLSCTLSLLCCKNGSIYCCKLCQGKHEQNLQIVFPDLIFVTFSPTVPEPLGVPSIMNCKQEHILLEASIRASGMATCK